MKKIIILLSLAMPMIVKAQSVAVNADKLLSTLTANNQFSGNAVISVKGKIVFQKAYGYADVEHKRFNNLQTEFRAGSLTKMFTSALILQLMEAGELKLIDPVSKYVPQFANGSKITITNLLSHTSGIAGGTDRAAVTTTQLVETFKSEPLAFTPGSRFEYNNFNFILLAYIAQKITGVPYPQLIKQRVFNKAGMFHTGIDYEGRPSNNAALGYMLNPDTKQVELAKGGNVAAASGAGAMYTTVGDLLKFWEAVEQHKLFSASTFKLATTPVQPGYGLGWIISNGEGKPAKIGHTGSIEGFRADFMRFQAEDITIIFLSNLLPQAESHVDRALTAIAFNKPYEIEKPKTEVTVSADLLAKYAGTYTSDGGNMVVSVKDGKLMVLAPGGDTVELAAQGDGKFFVKGPEIGIQFKETEGKITSMYVDMRGGMTFTRVQ